MYWKILHVLDICVVFKNQLPSRIAIISAYLQFVNAIDFYCQFSKMSI